MSFIVYQITNTVNGKRYIGYTSKSLNSRWQEHCYSSNRSECHFHNAIAKYGKEHFKKEILYKENTIKGAKETEILCILDKNPEYNGTYGGDGWWGGKHSEETKAKISVGNMGKVMPKHAIDAVIKSNKRRKGEKRSPEWCQFMSEFMSNREISDETKNKISKTLTGYKHTEEACRNMGNSRLGKKRGPYKVSAERSPAQKAADEARRGVKRGPYKKKLKEQFHA
jgi:group I intron endonuclease